MIRLFKHKLVKLKHKISYFGFEIFQSQLQSNFQNNEINIKDAKM